MKTLLALTLSAAFGLTPLAALHAQQERNLDSARPGVHAGGAIEARTRDTSSPARGADRRAVRAPQEPQANAGIEPDEIDARASAQEPRAGLLLPAVQNLTGQDGEPCQTAGFVKFDPIEGDAGNDPAASGPGALAPGAGASEPCAPQATNFGVLLDGGSQDGGEDAQSREPGEAEITLKAPGGPDN